MKASIAAALGSALRKPIVLSPILAVAFVLTGIGLPDRLTRSFRLMGQVAGGAGQFLTGLIPIASTVLSVATLAAAIYFTADMGQP
jgi:malonate transporter and related proteins